MVRERRKSRARKRPILRHSLAGSRRTGLGLSVAKPNTIAQRVQDDGRTECRHSREPFDAAFRCINERRDIGPAAKLVHARLVTLHRTGRDETQAEIGDALGMSRHQVWRAIGELVAADLVQIIRYGLGRPNGYVLLGLAEDDLAGRASGSRPAEKPRAGQPGTPARAFIPTKKKAERSRSTGTKQDFDASNYYETSEGDLRVRG